MLKPITDKDLEQFEIVPVGGRACHYYVHYCLLLPYIAENKKWPVLLGGLGYSQNNLARWFYLWPKNANLADYLTPYLEDPTFINDIELEITTSAREGIERLSQADLVNLSNQGLADLTKYHYLQLGRISWMAATLRFIDLSVQDYFKKSIFDENKHSEVLRYAGIPAKLSYSVQEEMVLLELAQKTRSGEVSDQQKRIELEKIRDRFAWVTCGYYEEKARTIVDYKEILGEMINDSQSGQKKADTLARHQKDLAEREQHLADLDAAARLVADLAARSTQLKDYYKYRSNEVIHHGEPLFDEIARRLKRETRFVKSLDYLEISALLGGNQIDETLVETRVSSHVLMGYASHGQLHIGEAAENFAKKYLQLDTGEKTKYKGRTACRGYAKGIAKIVRSNQEFAKVEKGNILIAINTSPDYVPILKLVSAIVAEEGGLTAHVSVVSREFGIPCVVGVKRITEILKDGMEVEVDADNGIVRILKK